MTDPWIHSLTLAAALGCGLMAGVFFAFSTFVMRALGRLAPREGIAAMQAINAAVYNAWFMGAFLGSAALCLAAALASLARWGEPGSAPLLAGAVLYLVGGFGVTAACNVPRNRALAGLPAADPDSARPWAGYLSSWTAWNHVRAVASLAAAASFARALGS